MVADCPPLAEQKPNDRHLFGTTEQHFHKVTVNFVGSNSPSNLASRPAGLLNLDETDKFKNESDREAGALQLAEERTKTFMYPLRVITRQYEGSFPNWRQVVPTNDQYKSGVTLNPSDLDKPMVELLDTRPTAAPERRHPNLILHCGAHSVSMKDVQSVATPRSTRTWTPIPHAQLVQTVQRTLRSNHLTIGNQAHSLTHDGMRYFGLMEIQSRRVSDDYCWVLPRRSV